MNNEYYTALVAKRLSDNALHNYIKDDLDSMFIKIDKAVKAGEYEAKLNRIICDEAIKKLEDLGYNVTKWTGTQWDPANDTIVRWG